MFVSIDTFSRSGGARQSSTNTRRKPGKAPQPSAEQEGLEVGQAGGLRDGLGVHGEEPGQPQARYQQQELAQEDFDQPAELWTAAWSDPAEESSEEEQVDRWKRQ